MTKRIVEDSVRTHDSLYLDRAVRVKEYFKFIETRVRSSLESTNSLRVLDVGCATGDYLRFLKSLYPQHHFNGLEYLQILVDNAREKQDGIEYRQGDILSGTNIDMEPSDIVFMNGVNGMFDDTEGWLENICSLAKPGASVFIFGPFNPWDVDVVVRVRPSGQEGAYENGWNTISRTSVSNALSELGALDITFEDFHMPFDIEPTDDDPMRSWTVNQADGPRLVVNGAGLIRPQALLSFSTPV